MMNVTPVIFCGGSVTRLWPLSSKGLSKQFCVFREKIACYSKQYCAQSTLGCRYLHGIPLIFTSEDNIFRSKGTFGYVSK